MHSAAVIRPRRLSPILIVGILTFVLGSVSLMGFLGFILRGIIVDQSTLISEFPAPMYWRSDGTVRASVHIGGPFHLLDAKTGKFVSDKDFAGKWHLMYFGYTRCPDICPTELSHIVEALDLMGHGAALITPIFITIDPNRDNSPTMAHYVGLFSPRLVGLTGNPQDIDQIEWEYNVYALLNPNSVPGNNYDVVHSAYIYLINPKGDVAAIYPPNAQPEDLARNWSRQIETSKTP